MWFGTEAGLAKFDGRRTQAITDPNLPTGRVLALQTDQDGSLWIGTGNGASRLLNGIFQSIPELAAKTVTAIIVPDRSHAIMATEQGMIYDCHIDLITSAPETEGAVGRAPTDARVRVKQLLDEPLQSSDADNPGQLALTSLAILNNKLIAGSASRGLLTIENGTAHPVEIRPQAYFVRALEKDGDGNLWLGAKSKKEESGLYEGHDTSRVTRADTPTGPVTALRYGSESDMWVGSDGRGVFHFDSAKKVVRFTFDGTLGGLRSDHVYAIFVDREAVVWFGTDRGVSRYDPNAPRVEAVAENPESNFIRVIYQTHDGQLYSGTNRGLFVYDDNAKTWRPVSQLSRNIIYALSEDKSGRLLVGAASGLYLAQKNSHTADPSLPFTQIESASGAVDAAGSVRAITHFQNSVYIARFGHGIERVEDNRARRISSNNPEAISLAADGDRLLIGTTSGALVFNGQAIVAEPLFDDFKGATVRSISVSKGSAWFATSHGLYVCEGNKKCVLAAPNFDARYVVAIDNSAVREAWCATTGGGLLKVLWDDTYGPIVSQLDAEQGLPSQNVFAVWPQTDTTGSISLLIGSNRGVVRYTPGRIQPALSATRIISKRVHQPEELRSGLNLEYPQNSLVLDVTAISSRTFPEQFQYAFLLTDSRGKLIREKLARDSQFTMEGLKPGRYKVAARAFTKDLISSAPLTFEFSVAAAPFPWTSTALAVLLLLALLALLWAVIEHRRIVRTSAALVDANTELAGARLDLANEAERERRRIARDLHDQTLADLRRLLLITDRMPSSTARGNGGANELSANGSFEPVAFRKEIESVSNEIRRICEDLSPSVLDNVGLAAALEWALANAVAHLPPDRKFEYKVSAGDEMEEGTKLDPSERIQIYRIAQEVINNICRHSKVRHVWLSLNSTRTNELTLCIEDDGEFFAPNGQVGGRGLSNIHARASLIGADVSWTKRDTQGTVFSLRKRAGITGPAPITAPQRRSPSS